MPVDNEIYNRDANEWWSDNSHLTLLKGIIPARVEYLRNIYVEKFNGARRKYEPMTTFSVRPGVGLTIESSSVAF